MKKIASLIALCAIVAVASAKSVVFTMSNGTKVYYLLGGDENPVMKFDGDNVIVNTDTYQISKIKNFYISATDDPTAVAQLAAKQDASFASNVFVVKTPNAKAVKVFGVNGAEVEVPVSQVDGFVSVDMNGLKQGNYIIKVGNASFKVMKK